MAGGAGRPLVVAHVSDLHCGSPYFVTNLMERVVEELNELAPDLVVNTGDITDQGYLTEYKTAHHYLERLECGAQMVLPGNHDARNVGYMHFEAIFGERKAQLRVGPIHVVGIDSTEPDLDVGRVGRERYKWIREQFAGDEGLKILALHHHVLPVPGAGRERNIIYDAGDLLEVLIDVGVDIVLSGHKHVPYVWRLEDMTIVNAGTASSMKLRGDGKPCYNVIEVDDGFVRVFRKYPFAGRELIAESSVAAARLVPVQPPEAGATPSDLSTSGRDET